MEEVLQRAWRERWPPPTFTAGALHRILTGIAAVNTTRRLGCCSGGSLLTLCIPPLTLSRRAVDR